MTTTKYRDLNFRIHGIESWFKQAVGLRDRIHEAEGQLADLHLAFSITMVFELYLPSSKAVNAEIGISNSELCHISQESLSLPVSHPISLTIGTSRPGSSYRRSELSQSVEDFHDMKCDVMVNWLHQQQMERLWTTGGQDEGIMLKRSRGAYTCCPSDIKEEPCGFFRATQGLNVRCAMTVNTRVIRLFLKHNNKSFVPVGNGLRLQVLSSISELPRCKKHQFAAFIADRAILVVWDDEPRHLLDRASTIENTLVQMIWKDDSDSQMDEKTIDTGEDILDNTQVELGTIEPPRNIVMLMPILSAFTLALTALALGLGWRSIAIEVFIDGNYIRIAFIFCFIPQAWLSLFFFQALVGNFAQMFGPVSQMQLNTKFYSGQRPRQLRRDTTILPHVTIQMPVYKEGLQAVIEPTIHSIKAAISTYEMQGGTANIFINDDGLQLISENDARARQEFYDEHNIGWVARPKHNPKPITGEAFLRRGKFKKASNMNYAMWVSVRVESKLQPLHRSEEWTKEDEKMVYEAALAEVVKEDQGRTWSGGDIRIGDYILIIDSDTRVPKDCFLDAVSEMEQCPEVAIIQYASGVMNVTDTFFERGITFFTNLVYTQIRFAVANGDVAPFVGHNAILRWSALQRIAYNCNDDKREKYWSEETVSEDFDMALRLQSAGYIVRLAAYTNGGFEEGVSLTVYDELARWEKYAYGCNELIFHPLQQWFSRGPFTKLFRTFITSKMPLPSKLTILAYIGTYYALGSAWLLTLINYFLTGWANGHLDHYYLDSFQAYFSIIIVFSAMGNLALGVLRYRIGENGLLSAVGENFKWLPLLTVFLGGVSLHVSQAILSHFFSIDMSWGATSKEAEDTTFFSEIPKIFEKFRYTFVFCLGCAALMVICATVLPPLWRIDLFISIFPLCSIVVGHLLLPIALNPGLMKFTW